MRIAISPSSILIIGLFLEPGIQFYTGNFLDGSQNRHRNLPYKFRYGLALETQNLPDSPNHPDFLTKPTLLWLNLDLLWCRLMVWELRLIESFS